MCVFLHYKVKCKECGWSGWDYQKKMKPATPDKSYMFESVCPHCGAADVEAEKENAPII